MFKEYPIDPRLNRSLTWAEMVCLEEAYNNVFKRLHIGYAKPISLDWWPRWLCRLVVKPLIKAGYFYRPFKSCTDTLELTGLGYNLVLRKFSMKG